MKKINLWLRAPKGAPIVINDLPLARNLSAQDMPDQIYELA